MTENQDSLVNQPVDPATLEKESQETAQDAQEQFIPQVQSDPESQQHLQEMARGEHSKEATREKLLTKYMKYLQKIVVWGLILQGLTGIWKSIRFILIELPEKQKLIPAGLITQDEANSLTSKAILMTVTAIVTMVFAMKLAAVQSKAAKQVQTAIGIGLILANTWIMNFLNEQGSASFIGNALDSFLGILR